MEEITLIFSDISIIIFKMVGPDRITQVNKRENLSSIYSLTECAVDMEPP